ncbi:5'-3' exoribonuclease 1 isoform X2 [Rhipicephalus sanguineus]|uniref:5'-3' exoribonuclease 1 isoform X2 n=1 Tax=Rhipicephalus sanguineus TaxID=34632 RepID=UPI0020C3D002|nr:5'-3' exoribonuclease 1 isoform X2 [Rhipicephalus sanguineus]
MNAHQMSQQLGVNAQFVSRITGTVYIQMNSREAESASLVNVGLHLKFNKTSEEIPGYSKRTNDTWLYSTKCLQVLKEYLAKYLDFVQRILPFLGQDKISVEDLYPKGVGKEEVKEVAKWIKEQECTKVPRVKSGALLLDEGVVQAIEETINRAKSTEPPQEVLLDVHPKHLYRPGLQHGWVPPDAKATYHLFDRVVNVRENISVPLGYRGTIIGLLPLEDNEPQMCEVVFDEPFAGGLPLRCSEHHGYRISTLFLVNLSYGSRGQRSQQLYQVPARRQQQADSYSAVAGNKVRTGSAQPRATHASVDNGWQDLSPQRRQGKNRFHHSPNSPFEAQKSSPAPESSGENTSDFASLWLGLQKATAAPMACTLPPAQQASTSSQHQGTPLSLDELFKGARNLKEENSGTVAPSSASILEDLVKRTKESMGAEPEHFCIGMDGQKKMPASQLVQPTPIAVQPQRPNLPLPFGNPPPPLCGAGSLGAQFRMPPPCEASLIPDSFVESNRRLMETLNSMPSEQQTQQPGHGLSWQMPRMPPPFNRAPLYMATSPGKEPYQQRPFFPSPRNIFAPRPTMFLYQQHQQQLHRQPHPDSLLRPQFPARSPHKDRQPAHSGGGRYGEQQSEPCLPRPPVFPEHQLSASASVFVPTQVMRKQPASKSTTATASSSSPKKNKAAAKSTKSPPTKEAPAQKPVDLTQSASAKQQTAKEPEAANVAAPSSAQSSTAKPNPDSSATKSAPASQAAAASNSKPPARRSRLAVKFDYAPS